MMSTMMMMIFGVKDNDVSRGRSRHKEVPVCCFARSGGDETRGRLSLRLDQPSIHLYSVQIHLFDTVLLSQSGDDDYLPKTLSNLLAKKIYCGKSVKFIFLGPNTNKFPFCNRESCYLNIAKIAEAALHYTSYMILMMILIQSVSQIYRYQGCIFRLTCSHPELTEDHVLTSAYVKILRTVTRNAVNKSV